MSPISDALTEAAKDLTTVGYVLDSYVTRSSVALIKMSAPSDLTRAASYYSKALTALTNDTTTFDDVGRGALSAAATALASAAEVIRTAIDSSSTAATYAAAAAASVAAFTASRTAFNAASASATTERKSLSDRIRVLEASDCNFLGMPMWVIYVIIAIMVALIAYFIL